MNTSFDVLWWGGIRVGRTWTEQSDELDRVNLASAWSSFRTKNADNNHFDWFIKIPHGLLDSVGFSYFSHQIFGIGLWWEEWERNHAVDKKLERRLKSLESKTLSGRVFGYTVEQKEGGESVEGACKRLDIPTEVTGPHGERVETLIICLEWFSFRLHAVVFFPP